MAKSRKCPKLDNSESNNDDDSNVGIMWINSDLDKEAVDKFTATFYGFLGIPSVKKIAIKINSFGGNTNCGIAIAEEIRLSIKPVITIAQGTVASSAVVILQAGQQRRITKFSNIIMHKPASVLEGEYALKDLEAEAERSKKTEKTILQFVSERIKRPLEEIKAHVGDLRIFSAEEALAFGLVDEII